MTVECRSSVFNQNSKSCPDCNLRLEADAHLAVAMDSSALPIYRPVLWLTLSPEGDDAENEKETS
jgi:hypothetical protein